MATPEKTGCVWTADDKRWIKTWQRALQKQHDEISKQLRVIEQALPQFADAARGIAQPFLDACKPLLQLDGGKTGRKYQGLSRLDADQWLERARPAARAWEEFVSRRDLAEAAKRVREEVQRGRQEMHIAVAEWLVSPEFTQLIDKRVEEVAQHAAWWLKLFHGEYSDEELEILRRLLIVQFIRLTYEGAPHRTRAIMDFVNVNPPPSLTDVLRKALWTVTADKATQCPRGGLSGPSDVVTGRFEYAWTMVDRSVKEWNKKGIRPKGIPMGCFTIQGVDYSVAGR